MSVQQQLTWWSKRRQGQRLAQTQARPVHDTPLLGKNAPLPEDRSLSMLLSNGNCQSHMCYSNVLSS
jgi:hypothetical protein